MVPKSSNVFVVLRKNASYVFVVLRKNASYVFVARSVSVVTVLTVVRTVTAGKKM
jgi:hypothetical protein